LFPPGGFELLLLLLLLLILLEYDEEEEEEDKELKALRHGLPEETEMPRHVVAGFLLSDRPIFAAIDSGVLGMYGIVVEGRGKE